MMKETRIECDQQSLFAFSRDSQLLKALIITWNIDHGICVLQCQQASLGQRN